jgi:uncharacterized protein (TIGR02996 family)
MTTHRDADAFLRAILRDPSDVTTRLVFADWLEETGDASNVAWARYIRLMAEADGHPEQEELELQAAAYWWQIEARVAVPGPVFIQHYKPFFQFLPPWNLTVDLTGIAVPLSVIELIPESVARENLVLPLVLQDRRLIIAGPEPGNWETIQKLEFILNKDVTAVGAERGNVAAAIEHYYSRLEVESVSEGLVTFEDADRAAASNVPDEPAVVRLVNVLLTEAVTRRAERVRLTPEEGGITVSYRIGGEWRHRDTIPDWLWRGIGARLARMAWIDPSFLSDRREIRSDESRRGTFHLSCFGGTYGVCVTFRQQPVGIVLILEITRPTPARR